MTRIPIPTARGAVRETGRPGLFPLILNLLKDENHRQQGKGFPLTLTAGLFPLVLQQVQDERKRGRRSG